MLTEGKIVSAGVRVEMLESGECDSEDVKSEDIDCEDV